MSTPGPTAPYGSARDLPSIQEIERQTSGLKLLRWLMRGEQRQEVNRLEAELSRITAMVDSFYALLGERNWIFTDDLNTAAMEHVIDTDDPVVAEARLIVYYKSDEAIAFPLKRLYRFEDLRPRLDLLEKAFADYRAERYYSSVLVLLAVMDGFVNDIDKAARRGLHARPEEEMVAWDSVVGHHLGLSHAHKSFRKGFFKTEDSEVTELFRNGIMHGMLVNFDNDVVATKAWNRLFAVTDMAKSWERQREAAVAPPGPTFRESLRDWMDVQRQRASLDQWQAYDYEPSEDPDERSEVERACVDFLECWQKGRWQLVGRYFIPTANISSGKLAVQAKQLYDEHHLSSAKIRCVRHIAAAVAHIDVELVVNGVTHETELRWIHVDDEGEVAPEFDPGRWTLSPYGPSHFLGTA